MEQGGGEQPLPRLTRLQLRLQPGSPTGAGGLLRTFVLDLYDPLVHGATGSTVTFGFTGRPLLDRELWFGWLNNYRVVIRKTDED